MEQLRASNHKDVIVSELMQTTLFQRKVDKLKTEVDTLEKKLDTFEIKTSTHLDNIARVLNMRPSAPSTLPH